MAAFAIGHIRVKDPAKWAEYRSKVPATLAPWGGEVVLRGHVVSIFTGEHSYTDVVVLKFPDREAASRWYGSPAYSALVPLREQAADMVLICCES